MNALFTGVGAAAAIELPVRAEVDLEHALPADAKLRVVPPRSDTLLVRAAFDDAVRRHAPREPFRADLRIESRIPVAVGLKSSSAVSVAVGLAVASALGADTSPENEARSAAGIARSMGQSATGAFDDALAAGEGGIAFTDNRTDQVLGRGDPDPSWRAVLWIPPGQHTPSPEWVGRFRERSEAARGAIDAAQGGDWLEAMRRNGVLVETVLGPAAPEVRGPAIGAATLASAVSGLGPAVALVANVDRAEEVRRLLPAETADVRVVRFRSRSDERRRDR